MQFIGLPRVIDIAERVLPEVVADWMNTKSVQNINISVVQKIQVDMLITWVIKWSKSRMPHRCTFRTFTHLAWALWDLSKHDLFGIFPDPGSQTRVSLSLESSSTIPFQAGDSYVKISEWGEHCSNTECPASSVFLAHFRGLRNSPTRIQARIIGVRRISFRILPIVRYSGQACRSPEKLVKWVFSDAQITGTIVAPAGSWSWVSHDQSPMVIPLYIGQLSDSVRCTDSTSRCLWHGRWATMNWILRKLSL